MIQMRRRQQRHGWADWQLAMEALWWLSVMRIALCLLPFKHILRWMGLVHGTTVPPKARVACSGVTAAQIAWAMRAAAVRTPWHSTCLAQALAGVQMLKRRSLPATLYLGAARNPTKSEKLEAHAWLHCGDAFLTGRHDCERFTMLATFTNK
jgi:hypothetical protein